MAIIHYLWQSFGMDLNLECNLRKYVKLFLVSLFVAKTLTLCYQTVKKLL